MLQMLAYVAVFAVSLSVSRAAAPVLYDRLVEPALFSYYLEGDMSLLRSAPLPQKDNARLVLSGRAGASQLLSLSGWLDGLFSREDSAGEDDDTRNAQEMDEETVRVILEEIARQVEHNSARFADLLRESLAELDPAQLEGLDLTSLMELISADGEHTLDDLISPETQLELLRELANLTVRPAATGIISVLSFSILFGVLSLIANLLLGMLSFVKHMPVIGGVNAFFGGLVGLLQGILLAWVLALLVYGVLRLTGGSWWVLSDAVVEKSFLFQYFIFPGLLGG